jgi:hypothetical protein
MIRQGLPDQPRRRPSQARQALDQGDRQHLYMGDSDDGNWSGPSSEGGVVPERRTAAPRSSNLRRQERPGPAQNPSRTRRASYATVNSNTDGPAYFSYNTGAVTGASGQAVPYGEYRNPFLPKNNPPPENNAPPNPFSPMPPGPPPQPSVQLANGYTSALRRPSQRPPPPFPSRTYPADTNGSNDPWYSHNYFQGNPYAPPMDSYPPDAYPYLGEPYFGNSHPPPSQHVRCTTVPGPWPTLPTATPAPPEYQLDEDWREQEEVKIDWHEARKQKQELEKLRAEKPKPQRVEGRKSKKSRSMPSAKRRLRFTKGYSERVPLETATRDRIPAGHKRTTPVFSHHSRDKCKTRCCIGMTRVIENQTLYSKNLPKSLRIGDRAEGSPMEDRSGVALTERAQRELKLYREVSMTRKRTQTSEIR